MPRSSRFDGHLRCLHKVRLYPTYAQRSMLFEMLRLTRELYNAMLEQRRDRWRRERGRVTDQYRQITELRASEPAFDGVYRECLDAVLHRLDLAYGGFFRRLKAGEKPGAPRFKSARRWNQVEFPHGDRASRFDATQRRMRIPGVGSVKLRKGRVLPETFGRVFVVHKNARWYAVFECHREVEPLPTTGHSVGIDRGVRALAALSTGELVQNVQPGSRRKAATARCQRFLDAVTVKDARGRPVNVHDPRRRAAVRRLARAKECEANARRDWLHKCSRAIVDRFDVIALEDLTLRNMTRSAKGDAERPGRNVKAKSGLNRALLDAGLGMLGTLIREKAAWAARMVIGVDPRYSSQECSQCGHIAASNRVRSRFRCGRCWYRCDADVNAARVILARGRAQLAPSRAPDHARGRTHDAA
jgi:putative transposase